MSHENEVKQCLLTMGLLSQVAWVPIRFAVVGKNLDLKAMGEWVGPWVVKDVYKHVDTSERVREHQRADMPSIQR